jgi:tRNA(Leu) C34 or U34 (ribose-2'-O)-methylase TrmL
MNIARNITKEFDDKTEEEIRLEINKRSYPYNIIALNIHGCLNVGNMMRTSNLCGCKKFIIFGRRYYDKRSCVGTDKYINYERVDGIKSGVMNELKTVLGSEDYLLDPEIFLNYITENHILPIFVEQDQLSIQCNDHNIISIIKLSETLGKIPTFIFGNETTGIPKNILETRLKLEHSYTLELKQMGSMQSFNVSNCCAILSYKIMEIFDNMNSSNI